MNIYYCAHCKRIFKYDSSKRWIVSYCKTTHKNVCLVRDRPLSNEAAGEKHKEQFTDIEFYFDEIVSEFAKNKFGVSSYLDRRFPEIAILEPTRYYALVKTHEDGKKHIGIKDDDIAFSLCHLVKFSAAIIEKVGWVYDDLEETADEFVVDPNYCKSCMRTVYKESLYRESH